MRQEIDLAGDRAREATPADCDREPIRVPGSIQPHGALLVLDGEARIVIQASENTGDLLGVPAPGAIGRPLGDLLGGDAAGEILAGLSRAPAGARPALLGTFKAARGRPGRSLQAIAHRAEGGLILELEVVPDDVGPIDVHALVDAFTIGAEGSGSIGDLARLTAEETRRLTGFDRVLIYRFDEDWHGTVVGESNGGRLPALLGHRFPASDIPAQARELYATNRLRIIPDSGYRPVPIVPARNPSTGEPLDLGYSTLRSVSPVHVEYMKNMGTAASMSVSILRDGRLWGLIACHHAEPRRLPFAIRGTCDLFARAFSLRLSALEHAQEFERRLRVGSGFAKLLGVMSDRGDFAGALAEHADDLVGLVDAGGAAILTEGDCRLLGETPTEAEVRALADWLFREAKGDLYRTDALPAEYPAAVAFKDRASGLLAAAVSKIRPSYVLWFRPEVVRTIAWGGDPRKSAVPGDDGARLHPRRSFETWMETVRDRSLPWEAVEVEGAARLREAIVGTVLRKAEEIADLNAELTRSNRELEAFSYSVSHDLRAPLRHIVGYAEMLREGAAGKLSTRDERCISTIIESSEYAGRMVDKLLNFSRLGRAELSVGPVDLGMLALETRDHVMQDAAGRSVAWSIGALPVVEGDLMMLRMAVRDLFSNAVKYTRQRPEAVVRVDCREEGAEYVFSVEDNGVGFDMEYADKLFGVFQRLHRWEDYEGTGIGLANVRRVIERHGGRTWARGQEGVGATFFFTLPKPPPGPAEGPRC